MIGPRMDERFFLDVVGPTLFVVRMGFQFSMSQNINIFLI